MTQEGAVRLPVEKSAVMAKTGLKFLVYIVHTLDL